MQIKPINNTPNFQAKIVITDNRIHNFVKTAYHQNRMDTYLILELFREVYPSKIAIASIINKDNKNYIALKNGVTGVIQTKQIENPDIISPNDRMAYIDLLKEVMGNKKFWGKK